jgi:hypothetical protein
MPDATPAAAGANVAAAATAAAVMAKATYPLAGSLVAGTKSCVLALTLDTVGWHGCRPYCALGVGGAPLTHTEWTRVHISVLADGITGTTQWSTGTTAISDSDGGSWPSTVSWGVLGWTKSAHSGCVRQQTMAVAMT